MLLVGIILLAVVSIGYFMAVKQSLEMKNHEQSMVSHSDTWFEFT